MVSQQRSRIGHVAPAFAVLAATFLLGTPLVYGLAQIPTVEATIESDLYESLLASPRATFSAFVTVDAPVSSSTVDALAAAGIPTLRSFIDFGIIYTHATGAALLQGATMDAVQAIHPDRTIDFAGDMDMVATRARESWDAKSTSTSPVTVGSNVIDGSGIGVAIVDSGVDSTHPDLAAGVVLSKKFFCYTPGLISTASNTCFGNMALFGDDGCSGQTWANYDNSDTTSGHGTHVAGIVAGRGVASDGRFMGAAPGASIYGLGVGEGDSILYALEAFNWIHCQFNMVSPQIRVVSNSWGIDGGSAYSATDPIVVATNKLVDDGLVVLFAAGNNGGTGSSNVLSGYAKNPKPGVLGVASYNDDGTATRAGSLSTFSSRGASSETNRTNWPDISAPGELITSALSSNGGTCAIGVTINYLPYYCTISGTSMSTPHVAGIVALLLEANTSLTPAVVEDVIEDHAVQFTTPGGYVADASNPTNGVNYGSGHGLVDAIASLADARVVGSSATGSPLPQVSQQPHIYAAGVIDGQVVRGVEGAFVVQWTEVSNTPVSLSERSLQSGNTATYGLSVGQAANFRVDDGTTVTNLADTLTADGSFVQMDEDYLFPAPGTYTIEAQINFGSGLVSFDSFVVHVV